MSQIIAIYFMSPCVAHLSEIIMYNIDRSLHLIYEDYSQRPVSSECFDDISMENSGYNV